MTGSSPSRGETDLARLLQGMRPALDPVTYVFVRRPPGRDALPGVLGRFHETEGETLILARDVAREAGLVPEFVARRIELTVHSDLAAVGFTARIAAELAAAGIPCNTVAAVCHDHLFVPVDLAERALAVLQGLETEARQDPAGLVYSVTVRIDRSLAEEWLAWMRTVHVPEIMATGCFRRCTVQRAPEADAGQREGFVLDYLARSEAAFARYREHFAPALQRAHSERYAGRFEAERGTRVVRFELPGPLA